MVTAEVAAYVARNGGSQQELMWRDILVVYMFFGSAASLLLSAWWDRVLVPRIFWREERALAEEVAQLSAEAEKCSSVDKLHVQSQLRRRIITLRRRLNLLQVRRHALTLGPDNLVRMRAPVAEPVPGQSPLSPVAGRSASSPTQTDRLHGTRSAVAAAATPVSAQPQTSVQYWREVLWYSCPAFVRHLLRLSTLLSVLAISGNVPALVRLPRDITARVVGQCNPFFLLTHIVAFATIGPVSLTRTSVLLHETDELVYEATRQLLTRNPHATTEDVERILSARAANPYGSVLCWYVLCIVVFAFAVRVMR